MIYPWWTLCGFTFESSVSSLKKLLRCLKCWKMSCNCKNDVLSIVCHLIPLWYSSEKVQKKLLSKIWLFKERLPHFILSSCFIFPVKKQQSPSQLCWIQIQISVLQVIQNHRRTSLQMTMNGCELLDNCLRRRVNPQCLIAALKTQVCNV